MTRCRHAKSTVSNPMVGQIKELDGQKWRFHKGVADRPTISAFSRSSYAKQNTMALFCTIFLLGRTGRTGRTKARQTGVS